MSVPMCMRMRRSLEMSRSLDTTLEAIKKDLKYLDRHASTNALS